MRSSAARILREDEEEDMSREAVLLQWERKIEAAERRPRRFERVRSAQGEVGTVEDLRPADGSEALAHGAEQAHLEADAPEGDAAGAPAESTRGALRGASAEPSHLTERRTITITGQPTPGRRRTAIETQMAQPDRIALWAFLLGLFLVAVAAGTAHA
jgi:hypothetical protein